MLHLPGLTFDHGEDIAALREAIAQFAAAEIAPRDDVGQVAHIGAAVFLADGDAEYAEVAHLAPEVHRELVAAVDLGSARGDFGGGELGDCFAQRGDVLAMVKGQAWKVPANTVVASVAM